MYIKKNSVVMQKPLKRLCKQFSFFISERLAKRNRSSISCVATEAKVPLLTGCKVLLVGVAIVIGIFPTLLMQTH